MAIVALLVDSNELPSLTRDYVALKCRYFAAKFAGARSLDFILSEVKGSQILSLTRSSARNDRRKALQFRRDLCTLLEQHNVKVMARVWIKADGKSLNMKKSYGYAIQDITRDFNAYLESVDDFGTVIADSREHKLNIDVAHSVFTQKWKAGGDPYPRVSEVPTFAASDNHAGLQLADLVASTIVFPSAVAAYCESRAGYAHQPDQYEPVRQEFIARLKRMLFRYRAEDRYWRGGIDLTDAISRRGTSKLFE